MGVTWKVVVTDPLPLLERIELMKYSFTGFFTLAKVFNTHEVMELVGILDSAL